VPDTVSLVAAGCRRLQTDDERSVQRGASEWIRSAGDRLPWARCPPPGIRFVPFVVPSSLPSRSRSTITA